jgi:nitrous oxidase accessory protein NosD
MTKRYFAVLIAASALAILPAQSWAVTNAVVGKCRTGTQFATIQASINAADVGSTIQICSGDYPEILTITKNLTLKGVSSGKSAAVLITVPSAGVPQNATSGLWGMLAVQVLVQNASVAVNNISIDGGGGTTCTLGVRPVGILFQVAGGSMANSSVVDMPQCGGNSIPAFLDLTSNFTFSSNYLSGCDRACLEVDYGSNTRVTGNTIEALTATRVGIDVQQLGGPATVANNFIAGNFDWGIGASNSSSVSITGNTITAIPDGFGISLFAQTQSMVSNNRISGTSGISVNDDGVTGGNTITKNTVVAGFCGLGLNSTSTGDTISQNTYFNDTFTTCSVI